MVNVIYRFSFGSCVIDDLKNNPQTKGKEYFKMACGETTWIVKTKVLDKLNVDALPKDYNGDNYDLYFDEKGCFVKAVKEFKGR